MNNKLNNYQKIKKLLYWAKQTFLNEKGMEILPTVENLIAFNIKVESFRNDLRKLENELLKNDI